jgi:hypothetical protein
VITDNATYNSFPSFAIKGNINIHFQRSLISAGRGGGTVGILKTSYPHIQALSQDKEQGVQPRTAT